MNEVNEVEGLVMLHVHDHVTASGSRECCLGIKSMPDGYALMINPDRTHYYYVRHDGAESMIHHDRWAVYRWAVRDSQNAA